MGALKMTAAEEKRVFAAVKSSSSRAADPITDLIPDNGAKHDRKEEPFEWNDPGSGENASGDKQGITGKKKSHKETCFYEYDDADERGAARANQLFESFRVIERVEEVKDSVEHPMLFLAADR